MGRLLLTVVMLGLCYPGICFSECRVQPNGTLAFTSASVLEFFLRGGDLTDELGELLSRGMIKGVAGGQKVRVLQKVMNGQGIKGFIDETMQVYYIPALTVICK
ncbi:MAG: hypothetical protein V1897_20310 [Pseudomonadota bacterium]